MAATAAKPRELTQQDVCIDLPGETVQCWRSSNNIKVILRKHRDVIFDLNLGNGATYTVQATQSDFYNSRDKKLIYAKRRDIVTFKDGERLHLWVPRAFKGALVVRHGSNIMMKLAPNEVDTNQYDHEPKTKPAPIIVALGPAETMKTISNTSARVPKPNTAAMSSPPLSAAPIEQECSIVCIVDGTVKGMPADLVEFFKKGGGSSGLADIDPTQTATRNWILGQVAGSAAYVGDNWTWLRAALESKTKSGFQFVTARVHLVRGKIRFYFSGYSKYNTMFGAGGFAPGHDRIINIFAGVGTTSSAFAAVKNGIVGAFKKNTALSLIFGSATAMAEWKDDIRKDEYDLAAALFMTVFKAIVAAALTVAIVAVTVLLTTTLTTLALPVLLVGAVTLAAGVIANAGLEVADKAIGKSLNGGKENSDGLAGIIAPALRNLGGAIERNWKDLVYRFPADYKEMVF